MKKNQIKAGVFLSYVSLALGNIISIVYTPIMLSLLGQAEYGLNSLANSVIGYLGVLNFGLGSAVIKYTAKYRALEDKEGECNLIGMFFIIYSILAAIVVFIGGILIFNVENIFSNSLTKVELFRIKILMIIMVFNLAISFPFSVFGSVILAHEKFIFPKVVGLCSTLVGPLVMILLLMLGYKSIGMAVGNTIIMLITIGVNIFYCFKVLKIKVKFSLKYVGVLKEIWVYSFFIFLNIIVDKIYWSTDQLILGATVGTISVAVYSIGTTFNTYYMSFSTAISGLFLPKVTTMVTKDATDKELSDLFIKTGRIQYVIMSFILSGFLLVGRDFINVWAGAEYDSAYFIALVVMIPLTVPLIQNIGITILQAKNLHKFRSSIYIVIAIMNILASIPLSKIMGGVGCALATGISMVIGNIIAINIYYYKKINIDIPSFWKNIGHMTIPTILSLGFGVIGNKMILLNGYLGIFIRGLIFTLIFTVLMWRYGLNDYERDLFSSPLKKIKTKIEIRSKVA